MATATPEYKVILLGEYGVGKTTFLNQVQRITRHVDIFEADHVECTIPVGPPEERVTAKIILFDTAGAERYQRTLTNNYFRHADGALLVYDVADPVTFESLQEWIELTQKTLELTMSEQFVWCLVGNQKDRGIRVERGRALGRCEYLQTSLNFFTCALTGEGVMEVLKAITEAIHSKKTCAHTLRSNCMNLRQRRASNPCSNC